MKQRLKRFMAGFLAMLTVFTTLFTNGATAFAASPSANIAFWNASVKDSGEVSELKQGYKHGKILYAVIDGNAAYCMEKLCMKMWNAHCLHIQVESCSNRNLLRRRKQLFVCLPVRKLISRPMISL